MGVVVRCLLRALRRASKSENEDCGGEDCVEGGVRVDCGRIREECEGCFLGSMDVAFLAVTVRVRWIGGMRGGWAGSLERRVRMVLGLRGGMIVVLCCSGAKIESGTLRRTAK